MRNLRLVVEFEGTRFHGWQRQPDVPTVQGALEDAIERVFGVRADVTGAGRTDRGVHARDYVCNVHLDTSMPARRVPLALGAHLSDDVVVVRADDAPEAFHARHDALSRRYVYTLSLRRTALWRRTRLWVRGPLDLEAMRRSAGALVGEHDFTSFTPAANEAWPVCRLTTCEVVAPDADTVEVRVEANRFLHNMVRIIAGTLVEVGRGRLAPERVADILRTRDRRAAGPTLPPMGLMFAGVTYPPDEEIAARAPREAAREPREGTRAPQEAARARREAARVPREPARSPREAGRRPGAGGSEARRAGPDPDDVV